MPVTCSANPDGMTTSSEARGHFGLSSRSSGSRKGASGWYTPAGLVDMTLKTSLCLTRWKTGWWCSACLQPDARGFNSDGKRRLIGRGSMAERKMAFRRPPERPDLEELYESSRNHEMTDDELKVQRASFVYGNAPEGSGITKKSAKESVDRMRLNSPAS